MNQQTHTHVKQLAISVFLGIFVLSGPRAAHADQKKDEHKGKDASGNLMEHSADMGTHSGADMKEHHEHGSHSDLDNHGDDDGEETARSLWTKIMMGKHDLAELVEAGEYGAVHEAAETLANLLKELPELSAQLTAEKQKRVQGTVNNLTKVLDALHDAADEEGADALVAAKMKSLNGLFKVLKAQYPAKEISEEMEMHPMKGGHENGKESMEDHHSEG